MPPLSSRFFSASTTALQSNLTTDFRNRYLIIFDKNSPGNENKDINADQHGQGKCSRPDL